MKAQKILFISDIHLSEKTSLITEKFLKFLKQDFHDVKAIYILGDLFDYWIGDDDLSFFSKNIIDALRFLCDKKINLFFINGNRDFLLGKNFARMTGGLFLQDPSIIKIFNHKILLSHGDIFCTLDKKHQYARKILHNKILQKMFLLLPIKIRTSIAKKIRSFSSEHTKKTDLYLMNVVQTDIDNIMKKNNVNYLIHGHTHRGGRYIYNNYERFVLYAWHDCANVLECSYDATNNSLNFIYKKF